MDPITILIIAALLTGAALAMSAINDWITRNKNRQSSYATLIKSKLANGDYRVVSGIFDHTGRQQVAEKWESSTLDSELEKKFGNSDYIKISV